MSPRAFTLLALATLSLPACHSVPVAPPAVPDPLIGDILRGVSTGIALVTPRSDVSTFQPSYEYVIFPTAAYRWNSPQRGISADVGVADVSQACTPLASAEAPLTRADIAESTVPPESAAATWMHYCRGAALTSTDWDVIDHSKIPASLARCCASGCRTRP